ncbi:MAG: condensation domain-containing protein, partial [Anaerolineales bacterium]
MNFELSPKQRELLNALLREEGVEAASRRIPRRPKTSPAPLSFSQERLWYLNKLVPDSFAYNIPVAVRLSGPLDVAALERALNEV